MVAKNTEAAEKNATKVTARNTHGGSLERVSINLTPRSTRALDEVVEKTGDSKTDSINRAIQVYSYLEEISQSGGAIYIKEDQSEQLERLRFF